MTRPRLLDLFCGAGGAAMGYHRAGFDVVGVDNRPQPNYPFEFHQGDALEWLTRPNLTWFDAVHASPPCQAHTTMSNRWRGKGTKADEHDPALLRRTYLLLDDFTGPAVIENVPGAGVYAVPWPWIRLHGSMFGLGVHRPRTFWCTRLLLEPGRPRAALDPVGVYGKHHDGRRLFTRADGSIQRAAGSLAEARGAMGMPWADWDGLREAVPPAYTQFIGEQLLEHLKVSA